MSETQQAIVHEVWSPVLQTGFDGQRIAIVGYSHYLHAFEGGTHKDFWSRVYFFNFLPRSVGTKEKMYATGTKTELEEAQARFLQFLEKEQPDKVFVFTRKGWKHFPESVEERGNNLCNVLLEGSKTNWGTYEVGPKVVSVCGFQHPQYAGGEQLKREVQAFLKI